jgi:hypothetical protein
MYQAKKSGKNSIHIFPWVLVLAQMYCWDA